MGVGEASLSRQLWVGVALRGREGVLSPLARLWAWCWGYLETGVRPASGQSQPSPTGGRQPPASSAPAGRGVGGLLAGGGEGSRGVQATGRSDLCSTCHAWALLALAWLLYLQHHLTLQTGSGGGEGWQRCPCPIGRGQGMGTCHAAKTGRRGDRGVGWRRGQRSLPSWALTGQWPGQLSPSLAPAQGLIR